MPDLQQQAERRRDRIRRIADAAVRCARGHNGWQAYEAAKAYVHREHGAGTPGYDAIIDRIKTRLQI